MDIKEVIESLNAKMIRRHPHIFGEAQADSMDDLKDIWSAAKIKKERNLASNSRKYLQTIS